MISNHSFGTLEHLADFLSPIPFHSSWALGANVILVTIEVAVLSNALTSFQLLTPMTMRLAHTLTLDPDFV